jgi:hypothetical protein
VRIKNGIPARLILAPFSQMISDLEHADSMQAHCSWSVARRPVVATSVCDSSTVLSLLPVAKVRAAGWMTGSQ